MGSGAHPPENRNWSVCVPIAVLDDGHNRRRSR
jgi:hypothetical protein